MIPINKQAEELNQIIRKDCPAIYDLLSDKGKAIFFPKSGIIKQAGEAKGKNINATIGMAIEDDGSPMRLPSIADIVQLDPKNVFPYASSYGKPEMRKTWQEMIRKKNPSLKEKISLPVVTNALTHGLSIAGYMFVNPGEKIIVTDKYWGNYRLIFLKTMHSIRTVLKICCKRKMGNRSSFLTFPTIHPAIHPQIRKLIESFK